MCAAGNDNDIDNDNHKDCNNIIITIKDTELYVPVVTVSARHNQKFLAKVLKDQFIVMNIKQNVKIKIRQINIDILIYYL